VRLSDAGLSACQLVGLSVRTLAEPPHAEAVPNNARRQADKPASRQACRGVSIQLVAALLLAATPPLPAQSKSLFTWEDAALIGGFLVGTAAIAPLDLTIANRLQDSTVQENRTLGRMATFVRTVADPGSVIIGVALYAYGRLAKDENAADLGLHGTEALLVGAISGTLLKGVFGRERPYVKRDPHNYKFGRGFGQERYRSFPSGHTIAAFAAASAVASETRRWWRGSEWYIGPAMYGGAALTGISRIYNNRHWASDVMMGAAIGTMAGIKVVRYSHAHPENAIDRWLLRGSARRDAAGRWAVTWTAVPLPGR
jgi:membrane-associated phospholipid phosphatase